MTFLLVLLRGGWGLLQAGLGLVARYPWQAALIVAVLAVALQTQALRGARAALINPATHHTWKVDQLAAAAALGHERSVSAQLRTNVATCRGNVAILALDVADQNAAAEAGRAAMSAQAARQRDAEAATARRLAQRDQTIRQLQARPVGAESCSDAHVLLGGG